MSAPLADATNSPAKVTANARKGSFFGSIFGRKNSKETLAVKEVVAAKEAATPAAAAGPTFYTVVHKFNEGKAEAFWTAIGGMGPDDWAAMTAKHHALGFHNHSFLPTSPTGVVNCLWECKAATTPEEFQAFIDGPDGPGPGIFENTPYKVMPGAITPASFFAADAAPTEAKKTTGGFFWVFHEFKEGAAPAFWEMMGGMKPEDLAAMTAKNNELGFHNHAFLPCGEAGPCICIWEAKSAVTPEEFQTFMDGPDGPGAGAVFNNEVHAVMEGAVLPSARFTAPKTVFICPPCNTNPDKVLGPEGTQAMLWMNKLPDGRQVQRIKIQKGFDWRTSIGPILPGCPEWCPATHFGYLESGSMGIRMMDGSEMTIQAGETYLIKPGHLPILSEDAVMVEFSQDTTYTADIKK